MYKDKIDERIIGYLKEDSRESFVDIGKKLKLSESAVRRRVKNLVDSKTINKFTIELGENNVTSAIVLVSVDSATDTSRVSLKLAKLDGVKTVYEITGQYDITTIMSATSIAEINNSIDALRKITGVVDTNTVIILKKVI
jgi:DNA-binding Lrp family transcriptional regulator